MRAGGLLRRGRPARLASRYGWRAYAVPVLVVITVLAVFNATGAEDEPTDGVAAPVPTEPGGPVPEVPGERVPTEAAPTGSSTDESGSDALVAPSGASSPGPSVAPEALPEGGAFPESGAGTWHVVAGSTPKVGAGTGSVDTYTVEVEDGMDTSSLGGDESFARRVEQTLADPRGWTGEGGFAFRRIDSGEPDFRVMLTSQLTVRGVCGYSLGLEVSCRVGEQVIINTARWVRGGVAFGGDLESYRQYVINHEVGHAINFGHEPCAEDGDLAPVMMQQTFSTANDDIARIVPQGVVEPDGAECRSNPWPFPRD